MGTGRAIVHKLPLLPPLPEGLDLNGRLLTLAVVEGGDNVLIYDRNEIGHYGA